VASGKPKKVAIIACVRKMVVVLNTLLKNGTHWCAKSAVI
nr:IS110 family transposase [Plesiomonas shigelloides]MBW3794679.1 IS110 family transposase [Plesiomonas shigelloides]